MLAGMFAAFALAAVGGCSAPPQTTGAGAAGAVCDPSGFAAVRAAHVSGVEVTVCGPVVRVLRIRRSRSGAHRIFLVGAAGAPVRVDANVDVMGDFPIRSGEQAVVRGEYYDDGPGRDGVHWTHRTDRGTHPPGFVQLDGVVYR